MTLPFAIRTWIASRVVVDGPDMGFGIYRGLIGHVDKKTPAELLLASNTPTELLWDLAKG
jgi:hypothetical protein